MKYDPVKKIIGDVVRDSVVLRTLFYKVLGIMFLREWHVKRELRRLLRGADRMKVLDAGCGFGQYSYFCASRFPQVSIVAVDVKDDQISDCTSFFRKKNIKNVQFAVEDLTQLTHDNEFDLVLSVDVMEHIENDVSVFRNFHRALKSSGVLLVNTPSNLGGSDVYSPGGASFVEEHARVGYGAGEIAKKLETAGFKVEKLKFTYGQWGTVAWRLGIKYPMLLANVNTLLLLILPLYYIATLPVILPLMYLDYISENKSGTGLIVLARKQ